MYHPSFQHAWNPGIQDALKSSSTSLPCWWMSDKKTCSHVPQWFATPTPIPNDNIRKASEFTIPSCTVNKDMDSHSAHLLLIQPCKSAHSQDLAITQKVLLFFISTTSCQLVAMDGCWAWFDKGRISNLLSPGFKSLRYYFLVLCLNITVLIPKVLWKDWC